MTAVAAIALPTNIVIPDADERDYASVGCMTMKRRHTSKSVTPPTASPSLQVPTCWFLWMQCSGDKWTCYRREAFYYRETHDYRRGLGYYQMNSLVAVTVA